MKVKEKGLHTTAGHEEISTHAENEFTKNPAINPRFEGLNNLSKAKLDEDLKEILETEDPTKFPLSVFPDDIKEIVKQKAECLSYSIDYAAGAHFSAAALAIGAAVKSDFVGGYTVATNLYMSLVGDPGVNKSEPGRDAYKPHEVKDDESFEEYEKALDQYEEDCTLYNRKEINDKPVRPTQKKRIVCDITLEALGPISANNKRGVCCFVDELAGWLKNMNRNNSGSDQETWLSIFNGHSFNTDRISRRSIRVANPCISVYGTIQPSVLDEFAKDNRADNGFRDRILFIWPNDLKQPTWSRKRIDPQVQARWFRIIDKLHNDLKFTINQEGKEVPSYIPFSAKAEQILIDWQEKDVVTNTAIGDKKRSSISAKLYIYTLRFALIIQHLRWACGEAFNKEIDEESAKRAIRLAEYFRGQGLKVANHIKSRDPLEHLPKIKREVYLLLPEEFTTAQAKGIATAYNEGKPGDFQLPERTLEHWLTDIRYFEKTKHAHYKRKF